VPGRSDTDRGPYSIFWAEPRSYTQAHLSRLHAPTRPLTRRIAFWSVVIVPLLLIVFLGCYLAGAAPAAADAFLHAAFAPLAVLILRAVTWTYFLPLALAGASPSPVFAALAVYLVAGFALLVRRSWTQAAIVLLLPLLCTIPLSVIGLHAADRQVDDVKAAFSRTVTERESQASLSVTDVDFRFVVFDASGSKATVATVVTMVDTPAATSPDGASTERGTVFKDDEAAQLVRSSSGRWEVASLREDFHPGYEP
jgi:hypothetical protein